MSIQIKKLAPSDIDRFIELIRLFEDVFEMKDFSMPDKDHLQNVLNKNDFFVFVAIKENVIIGGLTAYTWEQYYAEKKLAYIFDLAVKQTFQRQGIGKMLMTDIIAYCKTEGMQEVFVQADEVDAHALDFYRATGGSAEKVIHYTYPL